jgi:cyclopropane fatty-acyl-phospholipid synthase-like methyltransferase
MSVADSASCGTAQVSRTTVDCYEFWDRVFRRAGVLDYTEGFYNGDAALPYAQAQHHQICHLLDQAQCGRGSRLLDIGCGNGTLLEEVRRRGASGVGVTIAPSQVRHCQSRGLDVHLLNYREIGDDWRGRFDAVIANGPMEHFVQPRDAVAGRAGEIYREFFRMAHRCIDPQSPARRLVNTTIHFGRVHMAPRDALRSAWSFPWFSDRFHYAMLVQGFGGYYPSLGQLERCAGPWFRLVYQRDATEDYRLTSEAWLGHGLRSLLNPVQWARLLPFALRHPRHAARMLFLLLVSQSWNWQFRTDQPPMTHLWQTWEYQNAPLRL